MGTKQRNKSTGPLITHDYILFIWQWTFGPIHHRKWNVKENCEYSVMQASQANIINTYAAFWLYIALCCKISKNLFTNITASNQRNGHWQNTFGIYNMFSDFNFFSSDLWVISSLHFFIENLWCCSWLWWLWWKW